MSVRDNRGDGDTTASYDVGTRANRTGLAGTSLKAKTSLGLATPRVATQLGRSIVDADEEGAGAILDRDIAPSNAGALAWTGWYMF